MILRLRHAVPWLQKFSGWSTCTPPPPVSRRFAGTTWTGATLTPSASDAEAHPSDADGGTSSSISAGPGPEKKKRRSTRGAKATEAAEAPPLSDCAGGDADGPLPVAAIKRRASTRRSKVATGNDVNDLQGPDASTGAPAPAKRTQRNKAEEAVPVVEVGAAPAAEAGVTARRSSGAEASSSGSSDKATPAASEKRVGKGSSKKATATKASTEDEEESKVQERASIRSLPFEDCLVLPRKAEHYLMALGLRPPLYDADAEGGADNDHAVAALAVSPGGADGGGAISNVLELANYLQRPDAKRLDPKELATPLLVAQYQGYLGPSPDYLYDLFYLDCDPPYLPSDAVRGAAVAAARSVSRASGLLSAKGSPPEALVRAAMDRLQADVGEGSVAAQEARAPRLTEAQLELFLLDWASARLAGLRGEGGIPYLARRCAALQLTRPIVIERLHRYAVKGDSLQDLAATPGPGSSVGGSRSVRLSQPMEALIEGLKAGVRLDPERLMQDFRLTSSGSPVRDHLAFIRRAVVWEAVRSLDPGGAMFYSTLVERLHVVPGLGGALKQQEDQWQREQGERDGSGLTQAQVRLLFHLWRLERFRVEEQARRRRQVEAASEAGSAV